jgi:hypothetical protein
MYGVAPLLWLRIASNRASNTLPPGEMHEVISALPG